jgi:membrane associated rhomboid family serine protease
MFTSIWTDIRREYEYGSMLTRVIIVNVVVFLLVNAIMLGFFIFNRGIIPDIFNQAIHVFCLGKSWKHNLYHPWVIFTHMFLHQGLFHLLWNMLYLYWFGHIVGDLIGNHRIFPIYLLGGLAGGLVFFLSANYFPNIGEYALGASAAVMAVAMTAGVMAPDYIIRLVIFGEIRLKYIVAVLVLIDLIGVATTTNSGGHLAHIGGAIMGYIYASQLRSGTDLAIPINRIIEVLTSWFQFLLPVKSKVRRPGPHLVYRNKSTVVKPSARTDTAGSNAVADGDQARLDHILDKIRLSGYDSLSEEEKQFLLKMSK